MPPVDFALPAGFPRPASPAVERAQAGREAIGTIGTIGTTWTTWTTEALDDLTCRLSRGGAELQSISDADLLAAWSASVEAFLDPRSVERQGLFEALLSTCALSPAGLAAGLAAVLGGVRRGAAEEVLRRAGEFLPADRTAGSSAGKALVLVVLSSNLPGLAVQPLLSCLALRRPVLLKSSSAEPLFAPAFVAALVRREPRLGGALAAVTWPGGDVELEAPVLAGAGVVLAYGGTAALADLARRAPGKVIAYGAKTSVAVIDPGVDGDEGAAQAIAGGLARDIALFDQRGCLSVTAVYVRGDRAVAERWRKLLERALAQSAAEWPAGPAAAWTLGQVQQARLESELRGLPACDLPLASGTVLLEPELAFRPSPGCRTVRVHAAPDLTVLPSELRAWRGLLQGAALSGEAAWKLAPDLAALGVSRFAAPGELQSPDASWHNGGIDPLRALAGDPAG